MTATMEEPRPVTMIHSRSLGEIECSREAELFFPSGLPGFEDMHRVLPVEIPSQRPLVYLQSVDNPEVCFASLPAFVIDPDFRLQLAEEELSSLELPLDREAVIGADVLCLALLISSGGEVRATLHAPIVINLHNSRAIQCVSAHGRGAWYRLGEDGRWERQCS